MRKRKIAALLLVMLMLGALLCACGKNKCSLCGKSFSGSGHSTSAGIVCDDCYSSSTGLGTTTQKSNTGVWIAITVMVFVAVFAATSGVVYLVLQKVLPPEEEEEPKPAKPTRRRAAQYDIDDYAPPARQTTRSSAAARSAAEANRNSTPTYYHARSEQAYTPAAQQGGRTDVWICPRDRSRNSGPYCAVCGAARPQAVRSSSAPQRTAQQPQRPAQTGYGNGYTQRQQTPAQDDNGAYAPTAQSTASAPYASRDTYSQPDEQYSYAPAELSAPAPAYTGKFAKKAAPASAPAEPEYDEDLLAAIFREAEQGTDEN